MKTKKNIQIVIVSLIAMIALTLNSCKKADTTPTPANGIFYFHLHTNVDTAEVGSLGAVYTMTSGRKITVTKAQLYLSNIQLVKFDGSLYTVPGVYILKRQEEEVYSVANVPSGNYISVRFNVGLNPTQNALTPVAADSTLNQPAMWFGATAQPSGFVFVNFQGTIDTTTAGTGTLLYPFSYKIGTNTNLKNVLMPNQNFAVSPNQIQYVHIIVDYSKLFTGIQLNNNSNLMMNTIAANATGLGVQLTNNIPLMFRYEY
jgi:hypothetical protein